LLARFSGSNNAVPTPTAAHPEKARSSSTVNLDLVVAILPTRSTHLPLVFDLALSDPAGRAKMRATGTMHPG